MCAIDEPCGVSGADANVTEGGESKKEGRGAGRRGISSVAWHGRSSGLGAPLRWSDAMRCDVTERMSC